jgi:uncharacterized protein (TIGR02448 family)
MRTPLGFALLACCLCASAEDRPNGWLVLSSAATTFAPAITSNLSREDHAPRRYARAREDAAAFVASDGHIRGSELEQALRDLHRQSLHAGTDDLVLARAILATAP